MLRLGAPHSLKSVYNLSRPSEHVASQPWIENTTSLAHPLEN